MEQHIKYLREGVDSVSYYSSKYAGDVMMFIGDLFRECDDARRLQRPVLVQESGNPWRCNSRANMTVCDGFHVGPVTYQIQIDGRPRGSSRVYNITVEMHQGRTLGATQAPNYTSIQFSPPIINKDLIALIEQAEVHKSRNAQ